MVNIRRLIRLTQKLIRINSENPPGDEARIAEFVKDYLENLGLKARVYEFKKKRANVVMELNARDKKRDSLLISPHLDTVPCGKSWHFAPFSGRIFQGKIYGLGSTDCKGNLACGLEAINSMIEDNIVLDYNLIFAATSDEESGSKFGLIPLLDKGIIKPSVALVLDSDDFGIIICQKGLLHLKVKLQGKKAHGAYPWQGVNAIDQAIRILKALKNHKFIYQKNKYLKGPTLNIGTIKGGDKVNVVADWCEFELDFRFLPGMCSKELLREIKTIIQRQAQRFSRKSRILQNAENANIEIEGIQEPYRIDENHSLIRYLACAMQKIKVRPRIKGSEGATTITFFQDKNIPAVACGFGSEGCAHIADEYAKIDNLYKGAQVLVEFLKDYRFN